MFNTSPILWLLIGLYCAVIVGVSVYYTKAVKNTDDFFGASKTTPWWAAGISYFMTAFSASAFVAAASFTYSFGGLKVLTIVLSAFVFLAGYFVFSKRWHRTGCKTAVEYIERRFGHQAAKFFVVTGVPIRILDNANRIYVTAVLTSAILNVPLWAGAALTTLIAFIACVTGGYLSVVATDAIQAVVLAVIAAIIAVFSIHAVGGIQALFEKLPDSYWTLHPEGSNYDPAFIVALTLVGIVSWNGYWSLVQRFVSVKTERDAQLVSLTSGISYYLLFPLFMLPPMIAAVLVPGLSGAAETEKSYLLLAQMILPAGMLGVFFFALVSATVTSLSGEFNVVAQVILEDVLRPLKPAFVEANGVIFGRWLVGTMAALCLVISLFIPLFGGSYHFLALLMGMTTLPTFLPLLAGLFYDKTPGWGAILAFVVGMTTSIIMEFGFQSPISWMVFANFATTTLTIYLTGLISSSERDPAVKQLFSRLNFPEPEQNPLSSENVSTEDPSSQPSMIRVIGVSLILLAGISAVALLEVTANHAPTICMMGALLLIGVGCVISSFRKKISQVLSYSKPISNS